LSGLRGELEVQGHQAKQAIADVEHKLGLMKLKVREHEQKQSDT
jgi:hypothetical protein